MSLNLTELYHWHGMSQCFQRHSVFLQALPSPRRERMKISPHVMVSVTVACSHLCRSCLDNGLLDFKIMGQQLAGPPGLKTLQGFSKLHKRAQKNGHTTEKLGK